MHCKVTLKVVCCERIKGTYFTFLMHDDCIHDFDSSKDIGWVNGVSANINDLIFEDDPDRPHKVARSNTDRDSATAFRSKQVSALNEKRQGPIQIQIVGDYSMCLILKLHILESHSSYAESKPPAGKKHLGLLGQCIRITLNKNSPDVLPASYEGIYNACRSIVTISHLGHDLYDTLKLELEKSIGNLRMNFVHQRKTILPGLSPSMRRSSGSKNRL
jgi:hypothetical protein